MKEILRYILYTFLLILIETVICILLFETELLFARYKVDEWHIEKALWDGIQINMTRVIFYYLFYAVAFYFLVNKIVWKRRLIQVALFNCILYIGISLLYSGILPGAFEYLSADFFYFLILATFLSPFVLGRKVQQKLLNAV
jgi:hypothetical protein